MLFRSIAGFSQVCAPAFLFVGCERRGLKGGGALFRLPFSVMGVVGIAEDGVADFVLGIMRMHGD